MDDKAVDTTLGTSPFSVVCAWCRDKIGTAPEHAGGNTYGICPDCVAAYFPEEAIQKIGCDDDAAPCLLDIQSQHVKLGTRQKSK